VKILHTPILRKKSGSAQPNQPTNLSIKLTMIFIVLESLDEFDYDTIIKMFGCGTT